MSHGEGLPEEVQSFLREHIASIDQLELLLLFERDPSAAFTAEDVARLLYLSPESAEQRAEGFAAKGILLRDDSTPAKYRITRSGNWNSALGSVARCYRERRVSVINYIFSNPIDTIQSFADAFIIRKKKE